MRFVVDENTLAVGKVMQQLRDDVAYVGDPLISDLIPCRSLDKHWIPVAAAHGWVAITNDHHMRTRHYEASLALEHGLMIVNIKGVGHRTAWDQLVRLTKHWQSVERFIAKPCWAMVAVADRQWLAPTGLPPRQTDKPLP